MKCLAAFVVLLAVAHPLFAGCPAGSVEVRRERTSNGHWIIYCQQISRLTPAEIATLDPVAINNLSPADKAALAAVTSHADGLPWVDTRVYSDPQWVAYARQQQQHFIMQRIRLMRLEQALEARDQEFTDAIRSNDELARSVLEDNMVNSLTVINCAVKDMARAGGIPGEVAEGASVSITTAITGLNGLSAARTSDENRKMSKTIDAARGVKSLLLAYPGLPLTAQEREALTQGTDALLVMTKIAQRWANGEPFDLNAMLTAGDDLLGSALSFPGLEPVKAMQASVHSAIGEFALWKFKQDQSDLKQAYENHMRAKEFINEKIAQTDRWLAVYRSSLDQPVAR